MRPEVLAVLLLASACGTPRFSFEVVPGPVPASRSPAAVVAAMAPGWNLGNTLEALPSEGDWANPPVTGAVFDAVKAAGFRSVRIPVFFGGVHRGPSASQPIDPGWLARVVHVVDMVRARGMDAVVVPYHYWSLGAGFQTDPAEAIGRVVTLWRPLAAVLRSQDDHVLFEVLNEPGDPVGCPQNNLSVAQNNALNARVIAAIRATGGANASRCVLVPLRYSDASQTTGFTLPADPNLVLTFHWYSPEEFVAGIRAEWGTATEVAELEASFGAVSDLADRLGVPVVLGETGLGRTSDRTSGLNPPSQQKKWYQAVLRAAQSRGFCPILWDNGDWLDRENLVWRDPDLVPGLLRSLSR